MIRFNIVGEGRYKNKLIELIETLGCEKMFNFIPKQPPTKIPAFMAACDCAFLSLNDNPLFAMTIPAKLQSYMACGMPIVASAIGETAEIIKDAEAGLASPPGNSEELAKNLLDLANRSSEDLKQLGTNSRTYYEKNFSKQNLLNQMDSYFNNSSSTEE
jgi:glycosyltransferase involved in cell wall biosynthesis